TLEGIPGTLGLTLTGTPGTDEQHVPLLDIYAMVFLGCIEVVACNANIIFEPFDAPDLWNIEQNAAADDTLFGHVYGALLGTVRADLGSIETVVHLALMEDVAERIEMSICQSMRRDGEIVADVRQQLHFVRVEAGLLHHMHHRSRIVGRRNCRQGQCQRDRL